jgi:hypothetical protein
MIYSYVVEYTNSMRRRARSPRCSSYDKAMEWASTKLHHRADTGMKPFRIIQNETTIEKLLELINAGR